MAAHPVFHKSWRYCTRAEWKPHAAGDREEDKEKDAATGNEPDPKLEQINQTAESEVI